MKILIVSDLFWPVFNGVSTFTRNLAHGLANRGHEVVVIAPSQTGKKYTELDRNYTIYRTKSVVFPFYQNIRISLTPQLEVRHIVQEFQPDIIHNQMLLGLGQAVMLWARHYGIPIVSTSHAMPENLMDNLEKLSAFSRPINYMLKDFGRRFHCRADVITAPTIGGLKSFGKFVDKVDRPVKVISNGINLSEYAPAIPAVDIYEKFSLPVDVPIVSYIGRMDAEKHLWVLVRAFAVVRESVSAHLLMVGDGVDRPNLERLVHDLGLSNYVTFTGKVSDEDKIALEHVATVFAMPSPAELQSIVMLEAMASGQPVVAVDVGPLSELCHDGKNGYLFALDDARGMAEGLLAIITRPELRKTFARESLRIAKKHDLEHTLSQFEKLYKQTIRAKAKEKTSRPVGLRDRIRDSDVMEYLRMVRDEDAELSSHDER